MRNISSYGLHESYAARIVVLYELLWSISSLVLTFFNAEDRSEESVMIIQNISSTIYTVDYINLMLLV